MFMVGIVRCASREPLRAFSSASQHAKGVCVCERERVRERECEREREEDKETQRQRGSEREKDPTVWANG